MAEQETQAEGGAEAAEGSASLLEMAIGATKQTERDEAQDLLANLTKQVMDGTVTWDRNLTKTIGNAITAIDAAISKQLAAIMHHEKLQKVEGSWRGLHHLVMNSETGTGLKIRMLNIGKRELFKDLDKAVEFDQSQIFKKIYEKDEKLSKSHLRESKKQGPKQNTNTSRFFVVPLMPKCSILASILPKVSQRCPRGSQKGPKKLTKATKKGTIFVYKANNQHLVFTFYYLLT